MGSGRAELRLVAIVLAVIALMAPDVAAQERELRGLERTIRTLDETYAAPIDPNLSLTERSFFDVGGYVSLTGIWLNDIDDNTRRLFQPEVTLYGRAIVDGAHTFFGRARFQYRDFSPGDSFDGRGDRWREPFLDRYWYQFDLAAAQVASGGDEPDWNFNVRVGRQFLDWEGGLVLSENLYAVRPTLSFGRFSIEGLAGVTPGDESVIDFDASRDGFDEDTERGFFGGTLRYVFGNGNQLYGYGLYMPDYNSDSDPRAPIGVPVNFDYEASYLGIGSRGALGGQFTYLGEFVYQFGTSQSDPLRGPQTEEDISAWAARGQIAWLSRGRERVRVELEGLFASGDDDRLVTTDTVGGNLSGTTDNAFNSLGFVNTGLAFSPSLSNLMLFRLGAIGFPFHDVDGLERLQLGADLIVLSKLDPDGPVEEATSDSRYLGFEADLILNYRITNDLSFIGRYGAFFPGDAIVGGKHTRHFVYAGVTLAF
ncbi:MAG: alginate export family protein [Planctomycetota bacterium]